MSQYFNFNDFPLFSKLTDIKFEPSTLLVETTDWSSAKLMCRARCFDGCLASRQYLALGESHKHLLSVPSSPLIPQSHATFLIPASSISSVRSTSWPVPFAPIWARDQHQIFSGHWPGCGSQNPPRSFKVGSHSRNVCGIKFTSKKSRNTVRIITISFHIFTFYHVVCMSRLI